MNILGLNLDEFCSAAIMKNGEILAACAEERFTQKKSWSGFPAQSIKYCLDAAGMNIGDIDQVAVDKLQVTILGIILAALAALVVPQFGQASADPDLAALSATLQTIRTQLQYYKVQHNGMFPPLANWQKKMLGRSRPDGTLSADGPCGPYLLQIPVNPLDGARSISSAQDGSGGWMYDEDTGYFRSNDPSVIKPDSPTKDL